MNTKPLFDSLYILEPKNYGWIIERLMRQISIELGNRGVNVSIGSIKEYKGQDIILHSRYLSAFKILGPKINSLWVTHFDDYLKIVRIKQLIPAFDSIINMSPDDDNNLRTHCDLPYYSVGINLPTSIVSIKPLDFVVFSACYPDGRKNESWIHEFCSNMTIEKKRVIKFTFLGWGWSRTAEILDRLEVNYEIVHFARDTPNEYLMYKQFLIKKDVMLYLGFDGGSMSLYDGIELGLEIILPKLSYHIGADQFVSFFEKKEEFFLLINNKIENHLDRLNFLESRSIKMYCEELICHWNDFLDIKNGNSLTKKKIIIQKREIYKSTIRPLNIERIRSSLIRLYSRIFHI